MKFLKIILIILAIIVLAPLAMCTVGMVGLTASPAYDRYTCLAEAKTEEEKTACKEVRIDK